MSIASVSKKESIFHAREIKVQLGVQVSSLEVKSEELIQLLEVHKHVNHVLVDTKMILKKEATEKDILFAYYHAVLHQQSQDVKDSLKEATQTFE